AHFLPMFRRKCLEKEDGNLNSDAFGQWHAISHGYGGIERNMMEILRPYAPGLVVKRLVRNFVLADQALHVGRECRRAEKLIRWEPPPAGWKGVYI
ncbi:hypothetical protein A2U01_0027989, partial [Trifolium medium]|nr:hypothetical protein [Trifolium medium]